MIIFLRAKTTSKIQAPVTNPDQVALAIVANTIPEVFISFESYLG